MKTPSIEERKNWWLKAYAYTSFEKSLESCNQFLRFVDSTSHELYLSLSIAIHTLYGRPFKFQKGIGKLQGDFVPDEYKGIHNCLITFRDKVLVHSDSDITKEVGKPFHDLVYHVKRDYSFFSTSDPRPNLDYYKSVSKYLPIIIRKVKTEIDQNKDKFDVLLPDSEGDYLFNIEGDKLFTIYKPQPNKLKF